MNYKFDTKLKIIVIAASTFAMLSFMPATTVYKTLKASVSFRSEAPMELIQAESKKLVGLLDTEKKSYAFQVSVISFQGFNSELQREHFNENYMESTKFPKIKFVGKIQEELDFKGSFDKQVTLVGKLTLHGVVKERTIKATLRKVGEKISATSKFEVVLADHNIKIPTIVDQKLAKVIRVEVTTEMLPKAN